MNISYESIVALAHSVEGQPVFTLKQNRPFDVAVLPNDAGIKFTPRRSGTERKVPGKEIQKVLEAFSELKTFKKSDYQLVSHNASYILALIKHFSDGGDSPVGLSLGKIEEQFQERLKAVEELSEEELKKRVSSANLIPRKVAVSTSAFIRSPYVAQLVLRRAKGKCEECSKPAPFKRAKNGEPYLEVHHRIQLAKGGEDTVTNAIALCPNCHRKAHYGEPAA